MGYLQDFEKRLKENDYQSFLKLWEEYCYCDSIDADELISILKKVKESDLKESFGNHVSKALIFYDKIADVRKRHEIVKLIFDLENTNAVELAEFAYTYLQSYYPQDSNFDQKLRLVGLREGKNFQGAISNFDLLSHIDKGKFVYHTAGWGTGEVLDFSLIREEVTLEFECVLGSKTLSFKNALKTLIPLADNHFLARRFGSFVFATEIIPVLLSPARVVL